MGSSLSESESRISTTAETDKIPDQANFIKHKQTTDN